MCVTSAAALPCRAVCSIRPPLEVGDVCNCVRQRFYGATGDESRPCASRCRANASMLLWRDVRMRLRCYGATGHCVHALGVQRLIAFTPLACNVWVRSRPWRATSECVHALGVQRLGAFTPLACNI